MPLFKTRSAAVCGIDAHPVDVEVDLYRSGMARDFMLVGMPDTAVRESRERIKSALMNSGFGYPNQAVTVNLAPAHLRKEGAGFDLPMALAILGAMGTFRGLDKHLSVGELSLDGAIRPVRGALSVAVCAREHHIDNLILPFENAEEASVVDGVNVFGVRHLAEVVAMLATPEKFTSTRPSGRPANVPVSESAPDFRDVRGQTTAKRGLQVAAAGGHNVLMIGPPGSGKTMLARRMPTILPPLTFEEALETTKIHSVAGVLDHGAGLVGVRPFRSPHHTISDAGLIGGGAVPRPGEVSLSHNGVLFLDELPEFPRNVLEVMRQPLEDGTVSIARAAMSLTFPARFMLAAAMNPCPCGYFNDPMRDCHCTQPMIQRYVSKISGPLLDRIDIHIDVPAVNYKELRGGAGPEGSEQIRERVVRAREIQLNRFAKERIYCNAQMSSRQIRTYCDLSTDCERLLERAINQQGLSARAHDHILKVARTVADLEGAPHIESKHIAEAIQYRSLDRTYWA